MNSYLTRILLCISATAVMALIFAVVPAQAQILRKDGVSPAFLDRIFEPFGLSSGEMPAGPLWTRWQEFETGLVQNAEALARCRAEPATCTPAEHRLSGVIDSVRNVEGRAKLGIINREINLSIAYVSDRLQHTTGDVWSPALSTFASGSGDCEDFAIAKYLALREAGVAAEDLRLLVVRLPAISQAHAVVAARLEGRWLILDNRRMAMVEDIHATDLQPLYAFDRTGVRQFGAPTGLVATAASHAGTRNTAPASVSSGSTLPPLM
jgi:predicted transglutaminase-like cysteine proteinase